MSVVQFPDGAEYDDDGSTAGTMLRGGHRQNLVPMLSHTVAVAAEVLADREASAGSATDAADSAGDAEDSAGTAFDFSVIADEEADRAFGEAERAKAQADRAENAAGSVDPKTIADIEGLQGELDEKAVYPSADRSPGAFLGLDEDGVEAWRAVPQPASPYSVGDILITARSPGTGWLAAGALYLQSAYTALFAQVGLLKDYPITSLFVAQLNQAASNGFYCAGRLNDTTIFAVSSGFNPATGANGIWFQKSADNGNTWTTPGTVNPFVGTVPTKLLVLSATVILGFATDGRIYRTADGGVSWTSPMMFGGSQGYDIAALTPTLIIASGYGVNNAEVLRSVDGGGSWSNIFGTASTLHPWGSAQVLQIVRLSDTSAAFLTANSPARIQTATNLAGSPVAYTTSPAGAYAYWKLASVSADKVVAWFHTPAVASVYTISTATWATPVSCTVPGGYSAGVFRKVFDGFIVLMPSSGTTSFTYSDDNAVSWKGAASTVPVSGSLTDVAGTSFSNTLFFAQGTSNGYAQLMKVYEYDVNTQFRAPSVAGITGAKAYIKAA